MTLHCCLMQLQPCVFATLLFTNNLLQGVCLTRRFLFPSQCGREAGRRESIQAKGLSLLGCPIAYGAEGRSATFAGFCLKHTLIVVFDPLKASRCGWFRLLFTNSKHCVNFESAGC